MTTTTDPTTAANERELPACPDWCEYPRQHTHEYDEEAATGLPIRHHEAYLDDILVSDASASGGRARVRAFVAASETLSDDGLTTGAPRVVVCTEKMPHLTPDEARQAAKEILEAAERADDIAGVQPHWSQADALGDLAALMAVIERELYLLEGVKKLQAEGRGDTRGAGASLRGRAGGHPSPPRRRPRLMARRRRRLTPSQVSTDLGVTRDYVVKLILSGELKAHFAVDERDLDRWIEARPFGRA